MISSISSGIDYNSILSSASSSTSSSSNSLSYQQQQSIDDILSNYDSSNLTQDDALSIIASLQDAGISPSKQVDNAMASLGFDAAEIGELSGLSASNDTDAISVSGQIGGMPPPPPPSSSEDDDDDDDEDTYSTVQTLLDSLFSDEEDENSTVNSSDTSSDYSDKASNLTKEAKQELINLFNKYNSEDSEYSAEDATTLVKSYLSEMLSDSKNYNHSSLYA